MENPPGGRKLRPRRDEPIIPYDIIMEIVSRLPAKDALKFRCVCKTGRELIVTRGFIDLHIPRITSPTILVLNKYLSVLPICEEHGRSRSKILKSSRLYPWYRLQVSHDGLIVSKHIKKHGNFIIFNPVYRNTVTLTVPSKPQTRICGVFYHSFLKEYCTLWEIIVSLEPWRVQYKMLSLGSQPNWQEIRSPWTQTRRILDIPPVLVNSKYLYWIVEDGNEPFYRHKNQNIMEFDTTNEQIGMIPLPFPLLEVLDIYYLRYTSLLNVDGFLVLIQVSGNHEQKEAAYVKIWILEDRVKKLWTRSDYIMLAGKEYNLWFGSFKVIALLNGEAVILSCRQLYLWNLKLGTISRFGRTYRSYELYDEGFAVHVMSLASLKNCKSKIDMTDN